MKEVGRSITTRIRNGSDRGMRRRQFVYISTGFLMYLIYGFGGFDRMRRICDSNERLDTVELTVMLAEGNDDGWRIS